MQQITQEEFEELVADAIDLIPEKYQKRMDNIAFIVEDKPTNEQRARLRLNERETLLGLYEGSPLPSRMGQTKMLPDKITLFKIPLLTSSSDKEDLKEKIRHTVWHEVAHYFGLDHDRIDELDEKRK